ncbi:YciI family protein [Martelella soudanensis]|uniref:YciI family protein n=1 Tax=unclassified Martelella TaxID=2629616 RepID=UPI0015DFB0F8|nr:MULTISPECIES: YciI family protein [unclassified Martelella]
MPTPPELMAPMLKKKLYAVICTLNEGRDIGPVLADHLEYLIGLEAEGKLFASGPFTGDDGRPNGDGLILLRAENRAEAERLAAGDPFAKAGLRSFVVHDWMLMEGHIGIGVNLSRGTFTFA